MYAAAVPIFIRQLKSGKAVTIFGDGGQTRDLIFVRDVVQANLFAADHPNAPGQVFNICTGQESRIIDLVNILQPLFPAAPQPIYTKPRPGDIYKSLGSPRKAEEIIGFRPATSLADGLRATIEWMQ
jgi:UDP-glucose 4-epimerase